MSKFLPVTASLFAPAALVAAETNLRKQNSKSITTSNGLTVLTQNLFGLPLAERITIANMQSKRFEALAQGICKLSPDVVVLQEMNAVGDFLPNGQELKNEQINLTFRRALKNCGYHYDLYEIDMNNNANNPYYLHAKKVKPGDKACFSGIYIASKHKITSEWMEPFSNAMSLTEITSKADFGLMCAQTAWKGYKYVTVEKGGEQFGIIGTHLDPYLTESGVQQRIKQIHQINEFMNSTVNKHFIKSTPTVVAGDMNVDFHLASADCDLMKSTWCGPGLKEILESSQYKNKFYTAHGGESPNDMSVETINHDNKSSAVMDPKNLLSATAETSRSDLVYKKYNSTVDPMSRLYDMVFPLEETFKSTNQNYAASWQRVRIQTKATYSWSDKRVLQMKGHPMKTLRDVFDIKTRDVTDHDGMLLRLESKGSGKGNLVYEVENKMLMVEVDGWAGLGKGDFGL